MKNQISNIKIFYILLSIILISISCNRNDPIGGEFIDARTGDVICDTLIHFIHNPFSEYSRTGFSDFLYAGNYAISLLSFERPLTKTQYDSVLFVFFVKSRGEDGLYLRYFEGEFEEDSIIKWGYIKSCLGDIISDSPVWLEDTLSDETVLKFSLCETVLADSVKIALCSHGETSVFYSKDSSKPPLLKLFRGPLLETVEPLKDAFVDTVPSYSGTHNILIASGSFIFKDSISLSYPPIDFTKASSVNKAVLYLHIDSLWGPDPELCVRYKNNPSIPYRIEGETVEIDVTSFIDEWISNEDRFLVLEGREGRLFTAMISKDIMLEVVYTEKPKER